MGEDSNGARGGVARVAIGKRWAASLTPFVGQDAGRDAYMATMQGRLARWSVGGEVELTFSLNVFSPVSPPLASGRNKQWCGRRRR